MVFFLLLSSSSRADWVTGGHDFARTFSTAESIPQSDYSIIWSYAVSAGYYLGGSATVFKGKVFVNTGKYDGNDAKLICLDEATGNLLWTFAKGYTSMSGVTAEAEYDETGELKERLYLTGTIVVPTGGGYYGLYTNIFCLDAKTGEVNWQKASNISGAFHDVPAISGDNLLVGWTDNDNTSIYCFNKHTGFQQWGRYLGRIEFYQPKQITVMNDRIFAKYLFRYPNYSWAGGFVCFDSNNVGKWQIDMGDGMFRMPQGVTADAEHFYVALQGGYNNSDNLLMAIDIATGGIVWQKQILNYRIGKPTLASNRLIVPLAGMWPTTMSKICVFDTLSGIVLKEIPAANSISYSTATVADDKLFIAIPSTIQIYDLASGAMLWSYTMGGGTSLLSPITVSNKRFYAVNNVVLNAFGISNNLPAVNVGDDNINIHSSATSTTIISAIATDIDGDVLTYRWLENGAVIKDTTVVGGDGVCTLELGSLPSITIGEHIFTLEVNDGKETVFDSIVLTIENSTPVVTTSGEGNYAIGSDISLGGTLSDYDGDTLSYKWFIDEIICYEGTLIVVVGGVPVTIPPFNIPGTLALGDHIIRFEVSDGVSPFPLLQTFPIKIVDTESPTLSPKANTYMLWPPNHQMVDIIITANASDNSGVCKLAATIRSSEPDNASGTGNTEADYTEPVINSDMGTISFQLRAERSGKGVGRTYLIMIFASDSAENITTAEVKIVAPHDRGK